MHTFRPALLTALTTLSLAAPLASAAAARPAPAKEPVIEVTTNDVRASNAKVAAAYSALVAMWSNEFKQIGQRFVAPRVGRYEGDVMTACGVMRAENAEYCERNNTVYYDEVFVAGMAKRAANSLGTDGDMAAVGVIAHEVGHAVAMQLGHNYRDSYSNESTADCLAGAFTQQAGKDGSLEKGDLEEALFGVSLSGDPTLELTGNTRVDERMQMRLARQRHGTKEERTHNFQTGLNGGPGACLEDFRAR